MNRIIAWIFGERQFYAVQHHGGGTHRHGPYSKVEAECKAESFRRGGYSAWIESTKALTTGRHTNRSSAMSANQITEDVVEAVARAICVACEENPDSQGDARGNEFRWQDYRDTALAAINALTAAQQQGGSDDA